MTQTAKEQITHSVQQLVEMYEQVEKIIKTGHPTPQQMEQMKKFQDQMKHHAIYLAQQLVVSLSTFHEQLIETNRILAKMSDALVTLAQPPKDRAEERRHG